ncbi:hypothetical protein K1719_023291 [Acacia pycnantha]|nr:hypothetical protein K1719_023291 [Acacia pycnantha]
MASDHHFPPSTTTIESLPNHVFSEVLAKVGSSSMVDLYNLKFCSKNFLNLIEEDDYIYEHINMQKLPFVQWSNKRQETSFRARCRECRNPESLYREGIDKYFNFNPKIMDLDGGLEILKDVSMKGHVEARYVCGMILLCSRVEEQREQGFEFLSFFLEKLRCLRTCRNKVEACLRMMWSKNDRVRTMFKDHPRLCGFDMCRGLQETARLERGWPLLDDEEEDKASLISCQLCRWDYELHKFSKICF